MEVGILVLFLCRFLGRDKEDEYLVGTCFLEGDGLGDGFCLGGFVLFLFVGLRGII